MSDEPDRPDLADDAVWVSTKYTADGTYVLFIEFSREVIFALNIDQARAYSAEVFRATAIAQHDAAVLKQLTEKLQAPEQVAAMSVQMLRADRPELDSAALGPLSITPSVSAFTGTPYLACAVAVPPGHAGPHDRDGQRRWQWSITDAHEHAQYVLEGSNLADLDAAYRRWLIAQCEIDESNALNVVHDLGNFFAARN